MKNYLIGMIYLIENNASVGFERSESTIVGYEKARLVYTTIIVNDTPTLELIIYDDADDMIFWQTGSIPEIACNARSFIRETYDS